MSRKRSLFKTIRKTFQQISKQFFHAIKKRIVWLLRTLFVIKRRRSSANAGFVLPTVAMVVLVVVLLTTAILFRSFERSKNASNVRVNETVLRAAAPALDRAKAKLEKLFQDPRLPRSTPSDFSLSQVVNDNISEFTFGDETQLKLVKNNEEPLKSVWKYPVDTDNDGYFDSFTIYGIYFRTPTTTRARSPLEARAQPMDEGATSGRCVSNVATSADLVGSQGWYKVGSKLKRSIFVYTTTVPITVEPTSAALGADYTKYKKFTGNKGFAALEYQQDRERVPLSNNAVIYENDLEISPGGGIKINGRVFTNGNLLTRNTVRFYQVSSPYSCYYTEENSKIVVAGNVVNTRINENTNTSPDTSTSVVVDFFKDEKPYSGGSANIHNGNKTVPETVYGNQAGYNDAAYAQRIKRLVDAASSISTASLPKEVKDGITSAQQADATLSATDAKTDQLKTYFKKRTRRVPYAEVAVGGNALVKTGTGAYDYTTTSPLQGSGDALRPQDVWAFPFNPSNGTTETGGYAGIGIKARTSTNKIELAATDPAVLKALTLDEEKLIGDRVLVGNNLPQLWYDGTKFVSSDKGQNISGKEWDNNTNTRQRFTQANQLDDFGDTDRDEFWEKVASQKPTGLLDVVGGLRVITGAGIYLPTGFTTMGDFSTAKDTVWPDTMPVGVTSKDQGLPDDNTPYLQMRATAVYHYKDSFYDPKTPSTYQTPIACVASYYDPTNSITAKNRATDIAGNALTSLTGVSAVDPESPANTSNKSLNGIVYSASSLTTTGYTAALNYQASLKYPNGRWVNKPLKDALANAGNLTLSQQSAIDSAVCALKILDGSIGAPTNTAVPHGAIRETTLLDARQIKAIDKPYSSSAIKYDLDIEFRQPLEIRTTVLDLGSLKTKSKTGGEFLFPNSGIIYATRDDALPDLSSTSNPNSFANKEERKTFIDLSSKDFKLDSTRRPNGIMLINGGDLSRNATYKPEEKGLILASDLPVYVKGDFNKHTKQEFLQNLDSTWDNFYSRGSTTATALNSNFACRKGQFTSCDTGESWRPATVLADAITVLSANFREGYRSDGDYDLNDNYDTVDNVGNPVFLPNFDANGDGLLGNVNESDFGFDLNGNNNKTDTGVAEASQITASSATKINGFWDNNFVTSRDFQDSTYSSTSSISGNLSPNATNPYPYSSYFNNFVTPVQRRATFSEYIMEICPKLTVTACTPTDWVVGYDLNDGGFDATEKNIKANQLVKAIADAGITSIETNKLRAGTTARPATDSADSAIQRYPRRVAFLRHTAGLTVKKGGTDITGAENTLVLDPDDKTPIPLGIFENGGSKQVNYFPFSNTIHIAGTPYQKYDTSSSASNPNRPRTQSNALWFRTNKSGAKNYAANYPLSILNASSLTGTRATEQPLLVPVLQIQFPFKTPTDTDTLQEGENGDKVINNGDWFQRATATETNLVFAQGDTPSRPPTTGNTGELGGGLENFIRFLENWKDRDLTARGSFIQFKRSSYATAPWQGLIADYNNDDLGYLSTSGAIFGYPQGYRVNSNNVSGKNWGRSPFYITPNRAWGFDVALLTQLPDLFSQRFTAPTLSPPNEFYREVPRDDNWVKTLLCAAQVDSTGGYDNAAAAYNVTTPTAINYKYAVSSDQRPSCP
ncbi:hormogonium polysaccharide biosynthesis protein HpsA [Nostoc sp. UHCC 0302]|uniref:hormogonium polysaccharide biosynthesis protein HpsA n=1 Tax=Nostoc sp. UHCC 0302 TaxID=3134896 RepID=UPI00311CC104